MIKETSREYINFGRAHPVPRETGFGFALILLLGLALRLYGLGLQELRYDEAAAYLAGISGPDPLDPQLYGDNPPLYYHVIYFWTRLHESVWFARLFETLCGTAVIAGVYSLVLRTVGHKAALFAAFVQAASPFAILHSREAGAEAFAQLMTITALLALERYMDTGDTRAALGALTAQLLAVFASYTALPLIPVMLTAVYLRRNDQRGIWGEWLALQGLFLLPVAGWLYAVFESHLLAAIERPSLWASSFDPHAILVFINALVYGYFTQNIPIWLLAAPIMVLTVAGVADTTGRRLVMYFFLPLLLMIFETNGNLQPRHLFVFTPVLVALAGIGFAILNFTTFRAIAAMWVTTGLFASASGYYINDYHSAAPNIPRKEFSRAANYLDRRLEAGGTLYHAGKNSTAPMAALQPGRWRHQWLMADGRRVPAADYFTFGAIKAQPYGDGPAFPAWILYTSENTNPFHDVETAALRDRIERFAAPTEAAYFKGIALIRYVRYETKHLNVVENESGGIRLFLDRVTGEEFPANYRTLRPTFEGTILRLSPGGELEMSTAYTDAALQLTLVGGYPLLPAAGLGEGLIPAANGFTNSFCIKTTVSPKHPASLLLTTEAPTGDYRLFARVLHGTQRAALQAFVARQAVTAQPVIPPASRTGWDWLNLGTISYDGYNSFSIHITATGDQLEEAAMQSFFLIPLEGGTLYRKTLALHKGEPFHYTPPPREVPITAFVADQARGELLSVSLGR